MTNSEDPDEIPTIRHFIRICTVCSDKKEIPYCLENITFDHLSFLPQYIQWTFLTLFFVAMEYSINMRSPRGVVDNALYAMPCKPMKEMKKIDQSDS